MSDNDDLYRGRSGFIHPYEGPTQPEQEKPEGWEEMTLDERLTKMLAAFDDDDVNEKEGIDS